MFKHWPMRTKVTGGIALGLLVVGLSLGVWGYSTGKIKILAYQYWFPGISGGEISGKVTCIGPCNVKNANITLYLREGDKGLWGRSVEVSDDGTYLFIRAPFTDPNKDQNYALFLDKLCPPKTGTIGNCFGAKGFFALTPDNPKIVKNLTLYPAEGLLVISVRQIVLAKPGATKPSGCSTTGNAGEWDCPVSNATVKWSQGDENHQGTTDQNGMLKTSVLDYRMPNGGSVNITATKNSKSASASANPVGCQQNLKKVYIQ